MQLGATPKQVFIDGIAQLTSPYIVKKPESFQKVPITPNFDKEAEETLKHEGLPPLETQDSLSESTIVFTNVRSVLTRELNRLSLSVQDAEDYSVFVRNGEILSICKDTGCDPNLISVNATYIDL